MKAKADPTKSDPTKYNDAVRTKFTSASTKFNATKTKFIVHETGIYASCPKSKIKTKGEEISIPAEGITVTFTGTQAKSVAKALKDFEAQDPTEDDFEIKIMVSLKRK